MSDTDFPAPLTELLEMDVLRTFIAIAETGSFSRAAELVFRSPAALSMQIKRLEAQLNQPLFVRSARKVYLTDAGEQLLSYAKRLIKINLEAVGRFNQPQLEGEIELGISSCIDVQFLSNVLSEFACTHPAVLVHVVVESSVKLTQMVDQGKLDLALVVSGNRHQDLERGKVVYSESLVWAMREKGMAVERTPLPLALDGPGCLWRKSAIDALAEQGIEYRIAYSSDHNAGLQAALMADLAIAAFPKTMVKPPLCEVPRQWNLPVLNDYQVILVQRSSPSAEIEAIARYVGRVFTRYR
ncbi:MAG: HTH-type transcriptional regulator HdfR [Candidatus Celerinatantimonas neptuna]|nr:MAG: HTH-type transcriptional regulator HdfR [Candidatus Celerinatantimonas neptuna]